MAEKGFNMLLGQCDSFEQISQDIALVKAEVAACGRTFEPMRVAVAQSINIVIVDSQSEYDQALETRMAARRRTQN